MRIIAALCFAFVCAFVAATSPANAITYKREFEGGAISCTALPGVRSLVFNFNKSPGEDKGKSVFVVERTNGEKSTYTMIAKVEKVPLRRIGGKAKNVPLTTRDFECLLTVEAGVAHTCRNLGHGSGSCFVCRGGEVQCEKLRFSVSQK